MITSLPCLTIVLTPGEFEFLKSQADQSNLTPSQFIELLIRLRMQDL